MSKPIKKSFFLLRTYTYNPQCKAMPKAEFQYTKHANMNAYMESRSYVYNYIFSFFSHSDSHKPHYVYGISALNNTPPL